MRTRPLAASLLLLAAGVFGGCNDAGARPGTVRVFAASSLRDALPAIDASARYSFDGSRRLQLQIEHGAPADVFVSASPEEPRALHAAGRCQAPVAFATNRIVMLVAEGEAARVRSLADLRAGGRRVAVGAPGVPAGDYARALLRSMGASQVLRVNRVSRELNVASIAAKVATGSADAGFAYATDARAAAGRVDPVELPAAAQPRVSYEACVVRREGTDTDAARRYLARLTGDQGRAALRRHGFGIPGTP